MASRRRRFRARPKPEIKRPPANEEISSSEVRVIGADGAQLGVMTTAAALSKAEESGFDLVLVAQKANPPVARLIDIGKHMYEKRKKEAKQKLKSKKGEIKGVRIGFKIGQHDWELRLNQADNFLQAGNKVKLEMKLRGREKYRIPLAEKKMLEFIDQVPGGAKAEDNVSKSGNSLSVIIVRGPAPAKEDKED